MDLKTIPEGIYNYDIRKGDDGTGEFETLEKQIFVNHGGTILVKEPFLEIERYINIKNEIDFIEEMVTLHKFISKSSKK